MRRNLGIKNYFMPLPVLLISTYDEEGKADCMNAAWGGVHDTNQVHLCLDLSHKTSKNILLKKEFTLAFADKKHVVEADYLGVVSGNKVDNKLEIANLKYEKSEFVDAPVLLDFPLSFDCKVTKLDQDPNTLFIVADIVNTSVDEKYLNKDGKIDFSKLDIILFNTLNATYHTIGEKVGNAFKDGLKLK